MLVNCGEFLTKYAITVDIGKHRRKYFLDIYRGNYSGKRRNEKKSKKYDNVLFLQKELPTDLNLSIKTVGKSVYNI
jgi:hypothetical protein